MDAKNTTSLAIAAGLVAAFVLGGLTFAVAMPLTRIAAGAMMGTPAFVHGDRMGPRGHDIAEMHGEGLGPEGRGYGMPGEPDGMYGRGMMPGQRGEMREQLPEDHPRLDEDGQWRRMPGPRGIQPDEEGAAPSPEGTSWSESCPECPVGTF